MKSNKLAVGILAHVDAGKTTLSESILYQCGVIRKLGRVDHGDAFLDNFDLERARGITIFSKQAQFQIGEKQIALLDTPGHVDFSAEMERTLQVLDYAILVISGADGVQGHVQTLWRLLKQYSIPTFLFINKMDQEGADKAALMQELKSRLDSRCVDFSSAGVMDDKKDDSINRNRKASALLLWGSSDLLEELALCDESVLEQYLETGEIATDTIVDLIAQRKTFPCFFGSALKNQGVDTFLAGFDAFTKYTEYPDEFGARVFKITRDNQGNRLTYLKITGGSLKVKTVLKGQTKVGSGTVPGGAQAIDDVSEEDRQWEEKVDQIRIYSGSGYEMVQEAQAGAVCAVTGLTKTICGEGLGIEEGFTEPALAPVLTYQIILPEGSDVYKCFLKLRQLEEEEPLLHIVWKETSNEIHAQVMGAVQMEVLKTLIQERFGLAVEFGAGSIVYKETIETVVEGVGHFEPLRHYAEVHLLLEPTGLGTGMTFECDCSEDLLDKNWQRLIFTHLTEKRHVGVLTGSEITDMKITLKSGKAHQKHTMGGDFRQSTYRAIRQGLMQAKSVLLEPVYAFRLEIPSDMVGRAMTDIQRMYGTFEGPEIVGEVAVLTGTAPVVTMGDYQMEVTSYTKGCGHLHCELKGYEPCHNTDEVVAQIGYNPEADIENPTGSVFCAHGAGFVVPWHQVPEYMHLESVLEAKKEIPPEEQRPINYSRMHTAGSLNTSWQMDKELEEIFERTYGAAKQERRSYARTVRAADRFSQGGGNANRNGRMSRETDSFAGNRSASPRSGEKEYLLVDGYNIIFAWQDLRELAEENIEAARNKLMDILCNYQGYKGMTLILVYDAYKVKGNPGEIFQYHNIHVVYTKEAETADMYIEKTVHEIGKKYNVTVATSDGMEQVIIMGAGAKRMSANGLLEEIALMQEEIRQEHLNKPTEKQGNYLFDSVDDALAELMEDVRLGKKDLL